VGSARPWRMIRDGAGEAAWNMALDEALLEAVSANVVPPTLRLYRWERPAVTLGRFQDLRRTVHREECAARGVPLVRRITGGRGILHGCDLTISIAAPIEALGFAVGASASIAALYARLAEGLLHAFAELGIAATMGNGARPQPQDARGDCFAITSRADVVEAATGRKLLGTALHRRGEWVLQQTALPLVFNLDPEQRQAYAALSAAVFKGASAEYAPAAWPSMEATAVAEAILHGFAAALGASFTASQATPEERVRASHLVAERYACASWTQGRTAADPCI